MLDELDPLDRLDKYEFNIWSDEDDSLTLTAYRLVYLGKNKDCFQIDTSEYVSKTFYLPQDEEEIDFLLRDRHANLPALTDYDEWCMVDDIGLDTVPFPESIDKWLDELPDYELRTLPRSDEWNVVSFSRVKEMV